MELCRTNSCLKALVFSFLKVGSCFSYLWLSFFSSSEKNEPYMLYVVHGQPRAKPGLQCTWSRTGIFSCWHCWIWAEGKAVAEDSSSSRRRISAPGTCWVGEMNSDLEREGVGPYPATGSGLRDLARDCSWERSHTGAHRLSVSVSNGGPSL